MDAPMLANRGYAAGMGGEAWAERRREYTRAIHRVLGEPAVPEAVSVECAVLVTGLVILADWLASQEDFLKKQDEDRSATAEAHFAKAETVAPALVREAGLVRTALVRKEFGAAHGINKPNPLQRSIIEELPKAVGAGPGILVVTAATGDGKTETALEAETVLSAASGTSGLCFVLPTLATSDEMYKRIAGFVAAQAPAGSASVTLTHSMAWLNDAYSEQQLTDGTPFVSHEDGPDRQSPAGPAPTLPGRWLRGPKRPLLAQFAVGTIDQALMAVLPVKHNALRMLGLSGKTFVVDEAHAYDAYMQVLLGRLLSWLGALRCPVILLSATLSSSVADRLVKSYLQGAQGEAYKSRDMKKAIFDTPYPGWLYVDAATGQASRISEGCREEQAAERSVSLTVDLKPVRHVRNGSENQPPSDGDRLAVIAEELGQLVRHGGCAAVVCTTVDDAQATYSYLRGHLAGVPLELLHARLPGDERERRTRRIVGALGRGGNRPERLVVIATQVIEQSLDLDLDLVISDLAPMSQLLQRAGRCWRHERFWCGNGRPAGRPRPSWSSGPRLVVLDPMDPDGEPPKHWGEVYHSFLLNATSRLLADQGTAAIEVPAHVQRLVETVHGAGSQFDAEVGQFERRISLTGQTSAEESVGNLAAVPAPMRVNDLSELHRGDLDEIRAATRLGANSVRVLCCYRRQDGRLTLDPEGAFALPPLGAAVSTAEVRAVMTRTIPVREDWMRMRGPQYDPPAAWSKHPFLSEVVLLIHDVTDGRVGNVSVGKRVFRLDPELGLVHS
jgi:CRISPR-associated endonuclease/helicase Cas3